MNKLFNSNTPLGSAFGSIFSGPAPAATAKQSKEGGSEYRPTSISAHSNTATKICMDCHNQFPVKSVTEVHPVPGLTMYRCCDCVTVASAAAVAGTDPSDEEVEEFDPGKAWAKAWLGGG
jgi:hypothetical protein